MKVLLSWLADFAWILYAACGLGAVVYIARALALQRQLSVSLTAFEREVTARQVARLWRIALTFAVVGTALFAGTVYLLPKVMPEEELPSMPTLVGLVTPTPSPSPTATAILGSLPTITATVAVPSPPPLPTATFTPGPVVVTPTLASEPTPAYPLSVRFGDVAELVGYDLSATEIGPGQAVGLTLYWRALDGYAAAGGYWVFVHLLTPDLSRLVGQHDGAPAGGTRPISGWAPGEIIVDYHEPVFYEPDYVGAVRMHVGLYDPANPQVSVQVEGGATYYALPTGITMTGP